VGLEDPFAHLDLPATSGHLVRRPTLLEEGMQTYLSATRRFRISAFSRSSLYATWQSGTLMCPTVLASPARVWSLQEVQGAQRRSSFVFFQGTTQIWGWMRLRATRDGPPVCTVKACLLPHRYSRELLRVLGVLALRIGTRSRADEEERVGKVRPPLLLHKAPVSVFGTASAWRTGRRLASWGGQERGRGNA
jgi:hypothetical protein